MENIKKCVLWRKPELVNNKSHFELVETYITSNHLCRYMLKCVECGQLFFHELYRETKWPEKEGDYSCSAWVPVAIDDKRPFKDLHPLELVVDSIYIPRIQQDLTPEGKKTIYWMS